MPYKENPPFCFVAGCHFRFLVKSPAVQNSRFDKLKRDTINKFANEKNGFRIYT
jgi:hypothetical protein